MSTDPHGDDAPNVKAGDVFRYGDATGKPVWQVKRVIEMTDDEIRLTVSSGGMSPYSPASVAALVRAAYRFAGVPDAERLADAFIGVNRQDSESGE